MARRNENERKRQEWKKRKTVESVRTNKNVVKKGRREREKEGLNGEK